MEFKNPNNDYVESAGGSMSWLWVLLFGPIYWAVKGVWRHFVAHLFLAPITLGLAHLVYPFFVYAILKKHYLRMGWKPLSAERPDISNGLELDKEIKKTEKKGYVAIGALVCVVIGLVTSIYLYADFGDSEPDASDEIETIIRKKMAEADAKREAEQEDKLSNEKVDKELPEIETFVSTYFEFPGTFTTNLKASRKLLQLGLGVSTQYDDEVITNVEDHQLALRSEILNVMSEFTEEDIQGKQGRETLARALADGINQKLMQLEDFGGIEEVRFTSFVLQ